MTALNVKPRWYQLNPRCRHAQLLNAGCGKSVTIYVQGG
jgi:hypothetical protein